MLVIHVWVVDAHVVDAASHGYGVGAALVCNSVWNNFGVLLVNLSLAHL